MSNQSIRTPMRPALALLMALTVPVWAADAPKEPAKDAASTEQAAARPFLGIGMDEVDEALAYHLKLENDLGILVNEVTPGSAAAKMGLKNFDVVVSIDGVPIYTPRAFAKHVSKAKVGDSVSVEVRRGSDTVKLTGILQARPAELDQENNDAPPWMPPHGMMPGYRNGPPQRQGQVRKPDGSVMEWSIEDDQSKDEKPAKK